MAATVVNVQMQQRTDTAANWASSTPQLLTGEIGFESDTKQLKIGDGSTLWDSLPYVITQGYVSNPQTLSTSVTIPTNTNAVVFGPSYTVDTGVTLTVSTGSILRIL